MGAFLNNELIYGLEQKKISLISSIKNPKQILFVRKNANRKIANKEKIAYMIAGISITDKCNLNCTYCYQKFKTTKSVSQLTAKQIITRILTTKNIWENIEFRILGGEPFTEPQLLKDIINWTLNKHWGKKYLFRISTNGTFLSDDIKRWISKNRKKIHLILSLDGLPDIQNRNRSGSYKKIDLDFFKINWPEQPIKMTVTKESIHKLYESVIHIMNLGLTASFSLAGGEEWSENDLGVFCKEQKRLEEIFSNCNITLPPIYDLNFSRIFNSNDSTRQCGIGKNIVVYDIEGKAYPCHLFLPNTLNINYKDIPVINYFSDDFVLKDGYCNNCVIKNICPTCYAYNFLERGKCNERDHHLCDFFKAIIKSAASIKVQRILKTRNKYLEENIIKEIDAILYLNNMI